MQGPTGPTGVPPQQPQLKAENNDADFRRHNRGDRFDTAERHAGQQPRGDRENGRSRAGAGGSEAAMAARSSSLADLMAQQQTGMPGGAVGEGDMFAALSAQGRMVLAERAPRDGSEQNAPPPIQGMMAIGLPGAVPPGGVAPVDTPQPLGPMLAAKIEALTGLMAPKITSLADGMAMNLGKGGVAITLPVDPATHGLSGLTVTQHGTGATARIEVVLTGASGELGASLAAAAQALADRLQTRFPNRAITIIAEDAAPEVAEAATSQSALSALFAGQSARRDDDR
ncbi:MAG: hypothetical protein AAF675_12385 [Pseudomonadota bacterium]